MADWQNHEWKLLIGGELVDGDDGTSPIVNPATEEVVGEAPEASVDQALDAARAAQEAFPAWSAHPGRRAGRACSRAVADRLDEAPGRPRAADHRRDRCHRSPSARGCRCRSRSSASSATPATRAARSTSRCRRQPMPTTPLAPGGAHGRVRRTASRSAWSACISPYNFPLTNMAGKIAPGARRRLHRRDEARAAGPARDPRARRDHARGRLPAGRRQRRHVVDARARRRAHASRGHRHGVVHRLHRRRPADLRGRRQHDEAPAARARRQGRRGGPRRRRRRPSRSPRIGSVWAFHSGQICTAPTRAIVHRSRYDELVERARRGAPGTLKVGDPLDEDTIVGPVISAAQRDRIEGYIAAGRRRGRRRCVVDGRRPAAHRRAASTSAPTLLAGCKPEMTAGPGGDLRPGGRGRAVRRRRRGVAIANSTDFGLYDYVFTGDTERGFRTRRSAALAATSASTPRSATWKPPFGGFKMSGIGRDGGDFGLHAYTEMQSVVWPA